MQTILLQRSSNCSPKSTNMNYLAVMLCVAAVASAAPSPQQQPLSKEQQVPIVQQETDVNFDGSYRYSFESGDGTKAIQEGQLKAVGNEAGEVSQGSFSYVGTDGQTYGINYIADENGYQPQGAHLPQPPPIPDAIAKSLAYLATKPPSKDEEYQQ